MLDLIKKLCSADGVSGSESAVSEVVITELSKYAKVSKDKNGNIIGELGKLDSDYHIMFDAHIDQIGLIVTYIDENGFIKVDSCGGVDKRILPGSAVVIKGKKDILGIVCSTPPHLKTESADKFSNINDLFIDVGMNFDSVSNLIFPGDRVIFAEKPKELINNKISSPALDNRAGVASLLKLAEMLSKFKEKINFKISIVLSVQEEVSALGAKTATYKLTPDEAIVVDVSFATQPNVPQEKCGQLSGGPMIGFSPIINKSIFNTLLKISKSQNISYQLEIMGGTTGTNADKIAISKCGVPTGIVSIPLRYMHTPIEIVDIEDIENTSKLLFNYIKYKKECGF